MESVSLDLGAKFSEIEIFDPLIGTSPTRELHNVQSVAVWVTDHPMLVQAFTASALAASHV